MTAAFIAVIAVQLSLFSAWAAFSADYLLALGMAPLASAAWALCLREARMSLHHAAELETHAEERSVTASSPTRTARGNSKPACS